MQISSSAFQNGGGIPQKYTCDGEGINPPLKFSEIPDNTQSLALVMDDPDAPAGTFTHWIVWNIKPEVTEILEHSVPNSAVQGSNSANKNAYAGPCPPAGTHRYFFKLYALDTELQLDQAVKVDELMKAMEGHTVASAELLGTYSR